MPGRAPPAAQPMPIPQAPKANQATQGHQTTPARQAPGRTDGSAARRAMREAAITTADPRWSDVLMRNPQRDGDFYYSVKTTGVYCRPTCGARTPRPENVAFHVTSAAAEAAGFRACKRCRPTEAPLAERQAALVARLCSHIDAAEQAPNLEQLARLSGLSRYHVQRVFKAVTGLTPKAYAEAGRGQRIRRELAVAGTVTAVVTRTYRLVLSQSIW